MASIRSTAARLIAVASAAFLTVGMGSLLVKPGRTASRTAFVALVVGLGLLGAAGAVRCRGVIAAGTGLALLLLGFWQAVAFVVMLPASFGLLVGGVALLADAPDARAATAGANGR